MPVFDAQQYVVMRRGRSLERGTPLSKDADYSD
jgi:hypothetical protein